MKTVKSAKFGTTVYIFWKVQIFLQINVIHSIGLKLFKLFSLWTRDILHCTVKIRMNFTWHFYGLLAKYNDRYYLFIFLCTSRLWIYNTMDQLRMRRITYISLSLSVWYHFICDWAISNEMMMIPFVTHRKPFPFICFEATTLLWVSLSEQCVCMCCVCM